MALNTSWRVKLVQVLRALPGGANVDSDFSINDWGRLSKEEKVAEAERLAREAYRAGDKEIAQKWRDIATEIESHHHLGG